MWREIVAVFLAVIVTIILLIGLAYAAAIARVEYSSADGGAGGAVGAGILFVIALIVPFFVGGVIAASANQKRFAILSIATAVITCLILHLVNTDFSIAKLLSYELLQNVLLGSLISLAGGWTVRSKATKKTIKASDPFVDP